ncbi:MAG: winged helix-turn-helix domain-containing protein, partial [Acidobacteriota bacterium]
MNSEFLKLRLGENRRTLSFDRFSFIPGRQVLMEGDRIVTLPLKTCELLGVLIENSGKILTKDELIDTVWKDTFVEESNLSHHIASLRKTLGKRENGESFIETIRSRGYRFTGDVRAFSHVTADRETAHPVNVERSDNIYSVADWRREPVADTPAVLVPPTRSKWFSPLILLVLVVVLTGIVFGIYKFSTSRGLSSEPRIVPFRESDITRLTTTGNSKRVAISPDGLYVAHITAGSDGDSLWVRQVAVANDTRIAGPSQSEFVWVTFAPDGNFVYYLTIGRDKGQPELFRVPVLGG